MHRDTPLILAIEPDQRQAARLARLISRRFGAELVVAETTGRALAALGTRIPELVLIPQLLSPQDEATLITTFRANAAAAHVQILTMPVSTSHEPETPQRGFLSRRKKSTETGGNADDPHASAFADQIASCLDRIREEREMREGPRRDDAEGPDASDMTSAGEASGGDGPEPNAPPASALHDRDVAPAAPLSTVDAPGADRTSCSLDPDQYSFAALLYRLHASTRTGQELR